jgi:hypothetical protein
MLSLNIPSIASTHLDLKKLKELSIEERRNAFPEHYSIALIHLDLKKLKEVSIEEGECFP